MRPITLHEITPLQRPVQHFSDCYLISSIGALARSQDGMKILSKNIAHCKDGYRIRFQNVHDKRFEYRVSAKEIQELVPLDKYYNEAIIKHKQNPILKAIEVAMNKLLEEHPDKKPFVSRLISCKEKFEYNKPSNFLEMFTGKKPIILNESSLRMDLLMNKDEAVDLFERIDAADDFSFVAGTGINAKEGLADFHCLIVEGVNTENQYVDFFECRKRETIRLSFDKAMNAFKFLTGYLR